MTCNQEQQPHDGQALAEYAIILVLIAMVAVVAMFAVGPTLITYFNRAVDSFP